MADANHGRGRDCGCGRGHGDDHEEEEPRNYRDQRDLEIAAMGRQIRELERQLAEAMMGSTNEERDEEESGSADSSEAGDGDEGSSTWGIPNRERNRRFRPVPEQSFQNLGVKIDIPEFEDKSHLDEFIDWLHTVERVFDLKDLTDK